MPNILPVIEEIENLINESIPQIEEIEESSFGYVVRNNEVTGISLYEKSFTELPESILTLKFLKVLNLTNCFELKSLPDPLELDHLRSLVLGNCHKLASIPESLPNSLEILVLSNCFSLTELHETVDRLPNLINLDLSYCKNLKQIPTNLILRYVRGLITIKTVGCLAFKEEKIDVTKTCHYCHAEILEDRFREYEGKYYCEECVGETFSSCRGCGEAYPSYEVFEIGGRRYCKFCYDEMYPDDDFGVYEDFEYDNIIEKPSEELQPPISQKEVEINDFKINEFLTLKLEEGKTNIYVRGERFDQCRYLMLNIPLKDSEKFNEIDSIDEAADILGWTENGQEGVNYEIDPETEFWGHCSNLQAWYEHYYDTRLLHSNLAFPLLKKLTNVGDPLAKKAFKEEIAMRLESGFLPVVSYLMEEGYLGYFHNEELRDRFSTLLSTIKFADLLAAVIKMPKNCEDDNWFSDLLSAIKETDMMRERFADLFTAVKTMPDDYNQYEAFRDLLWAIKGTNLINENFADLLTVVETRPDGFERDMFESLLDAIKGTDVMRERFVDLLNAVENIPDSWRKRGAFRDLLRTIKGTDVMRERFVDLLTTVETMPDGGDQREVFCDLIFAIKGTDVMDIFSSRIEALFSNILAAVETMQNKWGRLEAFRKLLRLFKGTYMTREKFADLLTAVESMPESQNKRNMFSTLLSEIKGTDVMREKFADLLTAVETMPDNEVKWHAFFTLIRAIKGTDVMREKFADLLTTLETMPDDWTKPKAFATLFYAIKRTDVMDTFSSRIETIFSHILNAMRTMPDNWGKCDGFHDLLGAIERTDLMDIFSSQIETTCSNLLAAVETMPDGKDKCNVFRGLLRAIEGTDLMDAFSSRIEALKKIC